MIFHQTGRQRIGRRTGRERLEPSDARRRLRYQIGRRACTTRGHCRNLWAGRGLLLRSSPLRRERMGGFWKQLLRRNEGPEVRLFQSHRWQRRRRQRRRQQHHSSRKGTTLRGPYLHLVRLAEKRGSRTGRLEWDQRGRGILRIRRRDRACIGQERNGGMRHVRGVFGLQGGGRNWGGRRERRRRGGGGRRGGRGG